jgi:hypothetical protein
MHPDPPWIYTKPRENQNCHFWHKILFNIIHNQQKIPQACLDCWKVVVMPRNLEELIATYFMQLSLNRACKCGTEGDRENTDRLYGGYFYNKSQEEGQECYELVKNTIATYRQWTHTLFGVPVTVSFKAEGDILPFQAGDVVCKGLPKVILKRGCTEYEQNVGRSDKWEVSDEQLEEEYFAKDAFVQDNPNLKQTDHQISHVIEKWIHNAFRWGDQSYLKFTNGNRLFAPPVTYHVDKSDEAPAAAVDQGDKKNG